MIDLAKTPWVLLSAYQCAPGQGSVSQIGWEWYSRLAHQCRITLVTHIRNRPALEHAGAPIGSSEVIYIDTEWFAGRLYKLASAVFPRSEHSVFLVSSLDYFVYDWQASRLLRSRKGDWDVIHAVTPVSPAAHTRLTGFGIPLIRGPINGGLRTPSNYPEFMRADNAWLYSLRNLANSLRGFFHLGGAPTTTLVANSASEAALDPKERPSAIRMFEIAVEPALYPSTPWPHAPGASNPLRILFVGRLVPFKALPLLLEAAGRVARLYPVEITVIGDGPMRAEWENNARDLKPNFLGACDSNRIAAELSRCHIFCLPSIRESGGAVLLEAMCAARPVLAVNYGGPAELVHEQVGRLVSAENSTTTIDDLEEALFDVIRNPDQWASRGEAGRRYVLDTHTWECRIEAGLALYKNLAKQNNAKEAA